MADATTTPARPGWQTTEFYLALFAKILGAIVASGYLTGHNTALQIAGLITVVLAQLGYTYSRTVVKAGTAANDNAPAPIVSNTVNEAPRVAQAGFARVGLLATLLAVLACVGLVILAACQTPAVKHAEATGGACLRADILQPLEGQGVTLLEKVGAALLGGAGKAALDDGVTQAKADISSLPASLEPAVVDCAIKAAIAAYTPGTGRGFAGGDAKLTTAAAIGERLLLERRAPSQ